MSDADIVRDAAGLLEDLHLRDHARRLKEVAERMEARPEASGEGDPAGDEMQAASA